MATVWFRSVSESINRQEPTPMADRVRIALWNLVCKLEDEGPIEFDFLREGVRLSS
jgi:hypothetical protein